MDFLRVNIALHARLYLTINPVKFWYIIICKLIYILTYDENF
jgi:hypothetical protein